MHAILRTAHYSGRPVDLIGIASKPAHHVLTMQLATGRYLSLTPRGLA